VKWHRQSLLSVMDARWAATKLVPVVQVKSSSVAMVS